MLVSYFWHRKGFISSLWPAICFMFAFSRHIRPVTSHPERRKKRTRKSNSFFSVFVDGQEDNNNENAKAGRWLNFSQRREDEGKQQYVSLLLQSLVRDIDFLLLGVLVSTCIRVGGLKCHRNRADVTNYFIRRASCIFDLFSREPDNFVHHIGIDRRKKNVEAFTYFSFLSLGPNTHPIPGCVGYQPKIF